MSDPIADYFAGDIATRYALTRDAQYQPALRAYFGSAAFAALLAQAEHGVRIFDRGALGADAPRNMLVLPGIMGSMLRPGLLGGVWWIDAARAANRLNDLALQPDGTSDIDPDYGILPFALDQTYNPLLLAIQAREDLGLVQYPYDWRKLASASCDGLRDAIVQTARVNGGRPVHLVGHSMGGLVIRATLARYGADLWPLVGKVVTIGTPHYGSPLALQRMKYHLWSGDLMNKFLYLLLDHATLRSFWGVVGLLPAPRGIYPVSDARSDTYDHPCVNFDLYDATTWLPELDTAARDQFQRSLDATHAAHVALHQTHAALDPALRARMLAIVGVGERTLARMAYRDPLRQRGMRLAFGEQVGDAHQDGDGTVTVASATLAGVETRYVSGAHGTLQNIPAVIAEVFRWLTDAPLQLATTPAEAVARRDLDGLAAQPGLYHLHVPQTVGESRSTTAARAEIQAQIDGGEVPEGVNLTRLF